MKHIPILFSTPMVQAKLEKRKTQTRRLKGLDKINASPNEWEFVRFFDGYAKFTEKHNALNEVYVKCPYGQPGDVLWVREISALSSNRWRYKADYDWTVDEIRMGENASWKPSIHMPKRACRMWDMVKDIRVERLQDISDEDAKAEGIEVVFSNERYTLYKNYEKPDDINSGFQFKCNSFRSLFISINGPDSWKANPWVWVVEFEPCAMPEDFLTR